ncbi:hypothetical protein Tco_0245673 [Tanacetum coccineum]
MHDMRMHDIACMSVDISGKEVGEGGKLVVGHQYGYYIIYGEPVRSVVKSDLNIEGKGVRMGGVLNGVRWDGVKVGGRMLKGAVALIGGEYGGLIGRWKREGSSKGGGD